MARAVRIPTGLLLGCTPNSAPNRVCVEKDCPTPKNGYKCCTPAAECGTDPYGNGVFCFPNPATNVDAGPPCDVDKCPTTKGGPAACCQLNNKCGVDTLGIGLCFAPPTPLCDLSSCPSTDGGPAPCCLANGQGCGFDTLGIGVCFAPPPKTCDLKKCKGDGDIKACCLPNGACGLDSLGIGFCFPPPPPVVDAGPPVQTVTGPPDDPSVNGECPSYLGLVGPIWGCCSGYGVCGTFTDGECLLPLGAQLPVGPAPKADSGKTEPFLRCTPPPPKPKGNADAGTN